MANATFSLGSTTFSLGSTFETVFVSKTAFRRLLGIWLHVPD